MTIRYEDILALNWSTLKPMRESPLAYKHALETERKDTDAFRFGRLVHSLVLEPETVSSLYAVWTGGDRRGKAWDEFKAANGHLDIVKADEFAQARAAAEAVHRHPVAKRHLHDGLRERIVTWTHPETGRACKGRMDSVNGHLVELKTAADIDVVRFAAGSYRYGYHGQIAWYADGLRYSGVELQSAPAMIVVQSDAPHDVIVYEIGNDVLDAGRREYERLLRRLIECEKADHWPGRATTGEVALLLPAWAEAELDDLEPLTLGGVAVSL